MRYFSFTFIIPYIAFLVNKFSILFLSNSFAKVNSSQGWKLLLQIQNFKSHPMNHKLKFTFTNSNRCKFKHIFCPDFLHWSVVDGIISLVKGSSSIPSLKSYRCPFFFFFFSFAFRMGFFFHFWPDTEI